MSAGATIGKTGDQSHYQSYDVIDSLIAHRQSPTAHLQLIPNARFLSIRQLIPFQHVLWTRCDPMYDAFNQRHPFESDEKVFRYKVGSYNSNANLHLSHRTNAIARGSTKNTNDMNCACIEPRTASCATNLRKNDQHAGEIGSLNKMVLTCYTLRGLSCRSLNDNPSSLSTRLQIRQTSCEMSWKRRWAPESFGLQIKLHQCQTRRFDHGCLHKNILLYQRPLYAHLSCCWPFAIQRTPSTSAPLQAPHSLVACWRLLHMVVVYVRWRFTYAFPMALSINHVILWNK